MLSTDNSISMSVNYYFNKPGKTGLFLIGFMLNLIAFQQVKAHGLKYHEFRPIDHRLGMDASAVNCVVQDSHGMIWLGTDRGLYSFDGYQARHYTAMAQLGKGNIGVVYCALMVDSVHIWLGADNGLFVFNTFTDSFEPAPGGLPENIRAISRINDHLFWIGSINGLYRYDELNHKSEKINDQILPHQAIYTILRYDDNIFYFGTYKGLCRYNIQTRKFEKVSLGGSSQTSNQLILSLLPDYSHNCIWVGVEGGLFAYNPSSGQSTVESLFKGNSVKSLLLDNQNCLWAGTDNGLFIYEPSTKKYRLIRHDALNDLSLINNVVWSIFTDREQNIWIGTDAGASLFMYNDRFRLQSISELTGSSEGNYIISILADTKGNLWLGGSNGVIKVDKLHGKTIWYQQNNSQYPLPHNKVRQVFEDANGDVWIATDGSICRYNEKTSKFVRYRIEDATHSRNANWSYAICQDETRKLWIATCLGGLFVVDKTQLLASEGKTFVAERNYFSNNGAQALSGNMLEFLALDKDRNMWAGTYRAGINKIDRLNQKVVQFTTRSDDSPLPSDDVTAMIVDSDNFLWIAFRNRIMRMNPRNHNMKMVADPRLNDAFINSLVDDGKRIWMSLSSGLFYIDKATLKLKQISSGNYYASIYYDRNSHRVFAGGINEFVVFDPETILAEDQQNKIFVTSLWINDRLVQGDSLKNQPVKLGQSIRFSRAIELPYHFNNLSFSFSDLSYNQLQNVQYANKLEGLDAVWHASARGNHITYNNLPPGDYILMISRIGSDGNPMPNPLTFSVKIDHPWYSTRFAKCIYFVLFVLLVIAFVNYYVVLNRLRFERIEKVKTMELTAHKIDFLTNISHELKTPLSLIIGPLGKIMEQVKPQALKGELANVRQNALKMGSLIHQMMEASRQEFDGFGLIVSKTDVIAFVRSVVSVFEKPLGERSIRINLESNLPSFFIEADVLKLEVILNNIFSNASKFAPEGSVITIMIDALQDGVKLSVTDQGPGIDAQDLPHVFERFFQSRHTLSQNKEGSGVGLSIVKEYVQLHHGTVKVLSDGVNGTCVEMELPRVQVMEETEAPANQQTSTTGESDSRPLLLIVEDNVEILSFISKSLSNDFKCISALNGKLGLEAALAQTPDVIVTDIMMPVMDGMEMCRKLKENIATSLTPVVMLTAKDDKNTELLGYRTGADAFIAKPFEIGYLSDRLHQLLKGRNLLVQKARQEAIIQPKEEELLSADEKLLATITQIIESEITNPDLNVNVLCEKSGYSLKQIYRRIKSLTGQTAVDYIRSVRLKKAAMLLSRKTFTVAEVMYMVGFNNHSYFAKRFQEMYGKSPKQYAEGAANNGSSSSKNP